MKTTPIYGFKFQKAVSLPRSINRFELIICTNKYQLFDIRSTDLGRLNFSGVGCILIYPNIWFLVGNDNIIWFQSSKPAIVPGSIYRYELIICTNKYQLFDIRGTD